MIEKLAGRVDDAMRDREDNRVKLKKKKEAPSRRIEATVRPVCIDLKQEIEKRNHPVAIHIEDGSEHQSIPPSDGIYRVQSITVRIGDRGPTPRDYVRFSVNNKTHEVDVHWDHKGGRGTESYEPKKLDEESVLGHLLDLLKNSHE